MAVSAEVKKAHVRVCNLCANSMPMERTSCPHCARPQFFPNVDLSTVQPETEKLDSRYQATLEGSRKRGYESVVQSFEKACANSTAVFTCTLEKLHREVATGTQIYENYNDLERLRLRAAAPISFDWAKLRPQAEIELLGSHVHLDKIHYAALSLDSVGLKRYGTCTVRVKDSMVAHRASCFEGNTAIVYDQHHSFSAFVRSNWESRHILCVACMASRIDPKSTESDFPKILLEDGGGPEEDRYIEVHIFGTMTAQTFESIVIDGRRHAHRDDVYCDAVSEKLSGIKVQVLKP